MIFICALFLSMSSVLAGDSLLDSITIAESGAKIQAERLRIVSENIANADSLWLNKKKEPYRRKVIIAKNGYNSKSGLRVVRYVISSDTKTPFSKKYEPNHPLSDKDGYVLIPNVIKDIERADAMEANVSYDANLKVIKISSDMIKSTIDLIK